MNHPLVVSPVRLMLVAACSLALAIVGVRMLAPSASQPVTLPDRDTDAVSSPSETPASSVTTPPQRLTTSTTEDPGPREFRIANEDQWYEAVAAARPGDTLRLVRTINTELTYRADTDGVERPGSSGLPGQPITITANDGVWIDPNNKENNVGALDVRQADHIHVRNVNIRDSQFGLRLLQVRGTAEHPVVVADNTMTYTGHNAIKIGAQFQDLSTWSSHIIVENNTVSYTGRIEGRFGEGIYLGKGGPTVAWQDETHDIVVRGNDISFTTAEAIDVKPGTRNILVEDNDLHDVAPIDGGVISAHYSNFDNPKPNELDSLEIRNNRIWNVNRDGHPKANDWAIWVGQGGVVIEDNVIWGLRDTGTHRAVRIKSPVGFGSDPIVVRNNVFWTTRGAMVDSPAAVELVEASNNAGPGQGVGLVRVDADSFSGPVPGLGDAGTADAGAGPGSAFELDVSQVQTSVDAPEVDSAAGGLENTDDPTPSDGPESDQPATDNDAPAGDSGDGSTDNATTGAGSNNGSAGSGGADDAGSNGGNAGATPTSAPVAGDSNASTGSSPSETAAASPSAATPSTATPSTAAPSTEAEQLPTSESAGSTTDARGGGIASSSEGNTPADDAASPFEVVPGESEAEAALASEDASDAEAESMEDVPGTFATTATSVPGVSGSESGTMELAFAEEPATTGTSLLGSVLLVAGVTGLLIVGGRRLWTS